MKKKIKKYGCGLVINFTKEDQEAYGLVAGDIIDIGDMLIQKKEEKKDDTNRIESTQGKDGGGDNKDVQTIREPTPRIPTGLQKIRGFKKKFVRPGFA